jgi:predicted RNA-binding Zn ribbon-like protein
VADAEFLLLGDALWLDFVNTAAVPPDLHEGLPDPAALHRWTKAVRVEAPPRASVHADALVFRHKLLALAEALAAGRGPTPTAIESLNRVLSALEGREALIRVGGSWRVRFQPGRPPGALEAVARSAAESLSHTLLVIRRCANPECQLFFGDESPNHSRRWCSPARCGQRGRVERRRTSRPTPLITEG